jgi:hypothetical protein
MDHVNFLYFSETEWTTFSFVVSLFRPLYECFVPHLTGL